MGYYRLFHTERRNAMLERNEVWDFFMSLLLVIAILPYVYIPPHSVAVSVDKPVETTEPKVSTSEEPYTFKLPQITSRGEFKWIHNTVSTPIPIPTAKPEVPIKEPVVETAGGKLLGSDFVLTHYDACVQCCGNSLGITASGRHVEENITVSVDTNQIKLGSRLRIEIPDGDGGYKVYRANARADDTGTAIKGHNIDVYVTSHGYALECGRIRNAKVYLLED